MPANRAERAERTARTKRAEQSDAEQSDAEQSDDGAAQETTAAELDVAAAAQEGKRLIAAVTSKEPEGVTSVEPTDTGWVIEVEVLEDRHIPSSSDVLALYEVEMDPEGALLSYRRIQRYVRGRGEGAGRGGRGS